VEGVIFAIRWRGLEASMIKDFPFISTEAIAFLRREMGIRIFLTNMPSFDSEESKDLANHKVIFSGTDDSLIVELLDAETLTSGIYILDVALYPTD
jgi:kynurenine formamidase